VFWGDLYGTKGENPQEPVSQLAEIIKARKLYAFGELRDYWDHMNCAGWVRAGTEKRPDGCAVVLCNGSNEGCALSLRLYDHLADSRCLTQREAHGSGHRMSSCLTGQVSSLMIRDSCMRTRLGQMFWDGIPAKLSLERMDGQISSVQLAALVFGLRKRLKDDLRM